MLVEFRVSNFKNFKDELVFKLDDTKEYEFSTNAIKDKIVKTCLVYGVNGSGKSNLGLAMFDIVLKLTDTEKITSGYDPFLNLENFSNSNATFYYKFKFGSSLLEYKYEKLNIMKMVSEELLINSKSVLFYDHRAHKSFLNLEGTSTLQKDLSGNSISFVKYVRSNAVLADNETNKVFKEFINFVDKMLWFTSAQRHSYRGFKDIHDGGKISDLIIESGKLIEFEEFLRDVGLDYNLIEREIDGEKEIYCDFNGREAKFFSIASSGTNSLAFFFCWLTRLEEVSLVFIDEFDAYYHNKLSKEVIKKVMSKQAQAIITTHNTSIMDNDLLRPDCLFAIQDGEIKSFANSTEKELRKAHNIEKMYKAGAFDA